MRKNRNMGWLALALALLLAGGGFTGGYYAGKIPAQKKCAEVTSKLIDDVVHTRAAVDSLMSLPAKVDTVQITVEKVVQKADTIIYLGVEILRTVERIEANTDTIKSKINDNSRIKTGDTSAP